MRFRLSVFFFFILCSLQTNAYYSLNSRLRSAYSDIIQLRLQEGRDSLKEEQRLNPNNNLRLLYENYVDFLVAFITEEEDHFLRFKSNSAERIKKLNKDEKEGQSPFHLYALAEMTLQDALLKVKWQEYISSAGEIRKAYKMIQRNQVIFPTFPLNKKLDGFIHTLVGAVPQEYRWIVSLVGMDGTVPGGTEELKDLYLNLAGTSLECYRPELLFYLSNIHNSFSQDEKVAGELMSYMEPYTEANPLLRYSYVNTAMKFGRNEDALKMLQPVLSDKGTFPFYYLKYKRGLARLRKLDMGGAEDLRFFLDNFHGVNHRRSVYQKLAWIELLNGDKDKYAVYMHYCLEPGNLSADEDKDAFHEARSGELPNTILLRARLLFDGGYYKESWAEIAGKPLDSFPRFRDQLEVTYRLGRIMEKLNFEEKAVYYYTQTLKNGARSEYYFAANSALLLGTYYENKKNFEMAQSYYKQCLSLRGHDYQNSIDQKAQAGLDRTSEAMKKK